jgi:septum formation protein
LIQAENPALVLASASASRRALLDAAGLCYQAIPAAVDEAALKEAAQGEGLAAGDAAVMLADAKARHIARRMPEALVIGSDQLLVMGSRWFDKPRDLDEAAAHLRAFSGASHQLVNGTVAWRFGQRVWQNVSVATLHVRPLSQVFIAAYLAAEGEALLATVGAYRLEGAGVHLFHRIEGEHSTILGLAMLPLLGFLRQHGVLAE